ncbi:MAG: sensor histidine kinase [Lachnospiraceae bacterium]|jgi:signal transduction histidine kinase|nr:sensor histidine kinase [Lachnospiraceae bacterium]
MKIKEYLSGKILYLTICFTTSIFCGVFLWLVQADLSFTLFLPVLFLLGGILALIPEYLRKRKWYSKLLAYKEELDRLTLLPAIIDRPEFYEGAFLHDILTDVSKSMNDEIFKMREELRDYREFVELWVHEIKTPIAGAKLVLENNPDTPAQRELDRIEHYVEQALFYSRSASVENDYIMRETSLKTLVSESLKQRARYLIANKVKIETQNLEPKVLADIKWLSFILWQLMENAVKYGASTLSFTGIEGNENVLLLIEDDACGIPAKDIERIFDKGFTGENGRKIGAATGLGLYLCKTLCDKMGLGLSVKSEVGIGTTFTLVFPVSYIFVSES